ncbi:unnamed protein product [Rodentolepis nana]|uniref:PDZ domain-containing protein n=1 Tax=Rodentolepis nana TaxID=102285 RepID=A0A0R3TLL6_RODNA|nr:unnamed protein product [Rodentolepis nana]
MEETALQCMVEFLFQEKFLWPYLCTFRVRRPNRDCEGLPLELGLFPFVATSYEANKKKTQIIKLKSEWSEVELICLQNDLNNGLGFGLLGNKTTGVLVRNIVPGGSADLGGNLRPGDLILRVGDVSTRGLSPDQVARILRQTAIANYNLRGASAETNSSTSSTSTTTTSPIMSTTPSVSLLVARSAQGSPTTLATVFEKQSQHPQL